MSENPAATIFKPFLDRVSHPILSWVILFNIIFNYDKIIKLTLVITGRATTIFDSANPNIQYIALTDLTNFNYCNFILAIICGTTIGIIWPILDKLYQEHISKQAVLLEDAIANQKKESAIGKIDSLQNSLGALQEELDTLKNFFCSPEGIQTMQSLNNSRSNPIQSPIQIQIQKCDENVDVANFAERDPSGHLKLASIQEKIAGLVIAKISNKSCLLLIDGATSSQNILIQFPQKTHYKLINGTPSSYLESAGNWIAFREDNLFIIKRQN
ncbi:hypothetical protein M5D10_04130 [Leptospira santarosai]|uniref:hypothetical protein n=1 Tax=Leptospira santarosai TaxID=28183 RepID=UPI0022A96B6D|nr:hypothetical protein [Leptospira santarosai]UZN08170.1 hypothetical protein M5D10_04130 [Leptospira santarosai]